MTIPHIYIELSSSLWSMLNESTETSVPVLATSERFVALGGAKATPIKLFLALWKQSSKNLRSLIYNLHRLTFTYRHIIDFSAQLLLSLSSQLMLGLSVGYLRVISPMLYFLWLTGVNFKCQWLFWSLVYVWFRTFSPLVYVWFRFGCTRRPRKKYGHAPYRDYF